MCIRDRVSTQSTWGQNQIQLLICFKKSLTQIKLSQELNMAEKNQKDIQRTPFEPDSEIYRVSTKSQFRQLKYHAQQYLKKYANFELHAIKQASINATQLAQYLVNQKLATIEKIFTKTEELDNNRKALKLIIKLKRIPESK
eukprot:TRINITY_DN1403_c0_g1_i1.p1 TRINITY_DN1403_c0_g1~~TRINITY_DN1403_c0_g1_i1.p1  ORF type:complete len:142 (-),score=40.35 TRINITY_DN1403_c0_g1_i1:395-820(-)